MHKKILFLGLLLILAYSFCINIPYLGLREFQGEAARRAIIALEMLETKDFVVPHIEGQIYLLKPPLYNWILAAFFKIFNNNSEFIARLSSVIFVSITAIFISLLFRKIFLIKDLKFVIPGLIFLSFPEILDKASRAEIECSYVFLINIAIFSWFFLHEVKKFRLISWIIAYFFLSLATLDKTFQALSYFYPTIFCYLLLTRRIKNLFSYQHFIGLLAYIALFSLWLWALSKEININQVFHTWMLEYLWKKNAHNPYGFWGHFISFPLSFIKGYLPWIIFLPYIRENIIKHLKPQQKKSLTFFCLFSLFCIFYLLAYTRSKIALHLTLCGTYSFFSLHSFLFLFIRKGNTFYDFKILVFSLFDSRLHAINFTSIMDETSYGS